MSGDFPGQFKIIDVCHGATFVTILVLRQGTVSCWKTVKPEISIKFCKWPSKTLIYGSAPIVLLWA